MIAGTISESAGPLDGRFLLHTGWLPFMVPVCEGKRLFSEIPYLRDEIRLS